ncbi:scavenger mRNA decapping enzyme carboxy-term-binding protein (macronuclear) [Tetrahymena thermophila SB210]|uniref:Scavenger mRNA decapping enzyme carboxy-term-binding protein n=1 Tax=Tetrahymena thermophila (strain SB210) TaxID=312017 RepID=I7MJ19_TETTS|nr:scavenger mRNA decapping enzyme carboxy-term-binding protein [Tetrahymena thermophila SB210]EAS04975.3 scavenger mRNA decapping enzyme carboxy-term-binding protein [Tetrahymena thermophila SB210]|eukprot:XP_001025220.3 scavenger mRNA decapping enzyme carboxy-term-binding protein [Tetrahymena thermophila SB210]
MINKFISFSNQTSFKSLSRLVQIPFSSSHSHHNSHHHNHHQFTIFDKIIKKEIPAQIVYEDDKCLAFKDVSPQAPVHILLIPKVKDGLTQLQKAEERHKDILGHLMLKVAEIAQQNNLQEGYRVVINDGKLGCQSVYHLHLHILGGTQMGWPPGVLGKSETIKPGSQ